MRAGQQAGFHMNRTAVDHEADRAALIPPVVGKRRIGFLQRLDDRFRIEQAPEIVARQQHDLTTCGSNGLGHKRLFALLGLAVVYFIEQRDAVGLGP
jgi:hypothetical protein